MTLTSTNLLAKLERTKKVGNKQVLAFRGRIGWAVGDLPYSQLYTFGGSDSLRAYEDDQYRGKKNVQLYGRISLPNLE